MIYEMRRNIMSKDKELQLHKKKITQKVLNQKVIYSNTEMCEGTIGAYHYTSPEGLMGILKNREIFFTDAQFLNDYNERFDINHELDFFWQQHAKEYEDQFCSLIRNVKIDSFEDSYGEYMNNNSQVISRYFVLSASGDGDSLSMWKYYAKNGTYNGYNVSLFIPALVDEWIDEETGVAVRIGKVIYKSSEKQEKVKKIVDKLYETWCLYELSEELNVKICKEYKAWIAYASLFFKRSCFEAENEMRFVAVAPKEELNELFYEKLDETKVKMYDFRNVNGVITPYIKMPLFGWSDSPSWVIDRIGVGPCLDFEQKRQGILQFVDSLEYEFEDLEIEKSQIPVRY